MVQADFKGNHLLRHRLNDLADLRQVAMAVYRGGYTNSLHYPNFSLALS